MFFFAFMISQHCFAMNCCYLGLIRPSSTPSATLFTAFDISCLDVYARHTFKVALKKYTKYVCKDMTLKRFNCYSPLCVEIYNKQQAKDKI